MRSIPSPDDDDSILLARDAWADVRAMVDLGAFGGSIDPVRFEGSIEQGLVTFLLEDGDTVVVEVSADGAIQSAVFHSAEGAVLKHTTARAVSRANPEGVFGEDTKLLDV